MRCERCRESIPEGEEKERYGQVLCEDCYMDLLSPLKGCDPWAVHSAKTLAGVEADHLQLNAIQQQILDTLRVNGPMEPKHLSKTLRIRETDLERELAVLRHMEKVRGELRDGKRMIRLWSEK